MIFGISTGKYGDSVNSSGTVLNQQSESEGTFEKVTNSIDAVLTSECLSEVDQRINLKLLIL